MKDTTKPMDTSKNSYDDGNIPEVDLPKDSWITEPLPESSRPRKDGPGGDGEESFSSLHKEAAAR